jgi:subtilisin family serine protease
MPKVKGKEQLCSCEKKYFKSIQGLGNHTLFDRYNDIENVVNKEVDENYRSFLAEPITDDERIIWFSKPFIETPQRFSDLQDEDRAKYKAIKNDTISHYKSVINSLRNERKNSQAESLESAIKFINDDFLYCYDNRIVLGIWGMQIKDNVREPIGTISQNLFVAKKKPTQDFNEPDKKNEAEPVNQENTLIDTVEPTDPFVIHFNTGSGEITNGRSETYKYAGELITAGEIPEIKARDGYEFTGWNIDPENYKVTSDAEFIAQFRLLSIPMASLPWYRGFWNWLSTFFSGKGCLSWLLWLFIILLLILLFSWLFRSCGGNDAVSIPTPINEKPWVNEDPRVGNGGGIYDPGNPYESVPTPPEYSDVLPPNQGTLPPVDTTKIIRDPGNPVIIGNRLNILMENEGKSIMDLAKVFKEKYPDDKYKVVYYDDVVKRMQIEVPIDERLKLKSEIPGKFAPEYELFVFDESLFEGSYSPNDPAFTDADKSWYLKTINATKAWDITRGSPKLTIAIVDNGFSLKHPELQSKVVMPYNVWQHSKNIFPQQIDHGTHVAGTALAIADNGKGLCGIAPQCAFMPVQVANNQDLITTTSVLDGILYALYQGADVINVSLGLNLTGALSDSEQRKLQNHYFKEEERLWNKIMEIANKHKAVIVVAAGNENILAGINPMNRPKNFIIVSAVDKSNLEYRKTGFSNYGDYSTISAPGVDIFSSVGDSDYQVMEGTSMAAPIVTGTIALMKSLNKDLTSEQIVCILQGTGKPTKGKIGNLIQIDKALQKVRSENTSACNNRPETPSTGDVQILLSWNNYNDLDLVCSAPNSETVWFKNKNVASGGKLEIDMNANYPDSQTPIENVYWPSGKAPYGTYSVYLVYYKKTLM